MSRALRTLPVLLLGLVLAACTDVPRKTVVLIGGADREGPGHHDYSTGIRALERLLRDSPDARGIRVVAHPGGWPDDPSALDDAAAIVWYFDGVDRHPLYDPARRAQIERAMQRGAGLVTLHQASTIAPDRGDAGLLQWLGAVREGMFDRTMQWARLEPASTVHPVTSGLATFEYRDEFYPTLRLMEGAQPVLFAEVEVQYRNGARLVERTPERVPVAWAWQRDDGGRAFGYTGVHLSAALDDPQVRRMLLNAVLWTTGMDVPATGARDGRPPAPARPGRVGPPSPSPADWPTFQRDPKRTGWDDGGNGPARADVAAGRIGLAWESPPLDGDNGQAPRLYASPLYVNAVRLDDGPLRGETFAVVLAATNTGYVYAINADTKGDIAAGRILWSTRLGEPCHLQPAPLDGVPTGILSTPVVDVARARLYVTHCDPRQRWQAYALDLRNGRVLEGWPVRLDEETLNAVNRNAGPERVPPRRKHDFRVQRAALNLSPDGSRLYVGFGETETGWIVSVDTQAARVHSAFASSAMPHRGSGGIWGSGGPAVDDDGSVFVVTGSGFDGYKPQPHDWTQSVLRLEDDLEAGFVLRGTYTPFNHCRTATMDIDLGSGGAMLVPGPRALMVVGGKQGNAYLLDRGRLPGRLDMRPPCDTPPDHDGSLLPPEPQPQFGTRGPLNVFGPYSDEDGAMDVARSRSVPAFFRDTEGRAHVFMTGSTREAEGSARAVPPSLVRLVIEDERGKPWLRVAARQREVVLRNPGPAVVTSRGGRDAVVWVLDENAPRSALLSGDDAPRPVLYAFDALTLELLWRSAPGQLHTSGKYNAPAFARGMVFIGTDRIQAFAATGDAQGGQTPLPALADAHVRGAGAAQSAEVPAAAENEITVVDAAALYATRCAACHEHPVGNIPPRRVVASYPRARIVRALSHGAMRAQAAGLTPAEIHALARYLHP